MRQEAEFEQRLKSVADAEDQPVLIAQEALNGLSDCRCAEHCGDEFSRPIRLIAAAEPARQHEDLRPLERCGNRRNGFLHRRGRQVAHDEDLRDRPHALPCARRVILAVCPRKDGDADAGLGDLHRASNPSSLRIGRIGRTFSLARTLRYGRRKDLLERMRVCLFDICKHNGVQICDDARHIARRPDFHGTRSGEIRRHVKRRRDLKQHRTVKRLKEIFLRKKCSELKPEIVAEAHLRDRRRNAAAPDALCREYLLIGDQMMNLFKVPVEPFKYGKILRIVRDRNHKDLVARIFELGRNNLVRMNCRCGKRDKRRRNVQILECPGHGILAADRRDAELMLRAQSAEKRSKRLAPLLWIGAKAFEILLQRQANGIRFAARRNNLCRGLDNSVNRSMERTPRRKVRVKAERHCRRGIRLSVTHRNLCDHRLRRGELILSSERHEHGCRADGRIKTLAEPLLTAYVQIAQIRDPHRLQIAPRLLDERGDLLQIRRFLIRCLYSDPDVLAHTVRREKTARDPHNFLAVPLHDKVRLCCHDSDLGRLEILLIRMAQKCRGILRSEYDRHALLRL